jgi:hypothetical protein
MKEQSSFPENDVELMPILVEVYKENDYPRDRVVADKRACLGFTQEFNRRAGTDYSMSVIGIALVRSGKRRKDHPGLRLPSIGRRWDGPKFMPGGAANESH